MEQTNYTMGIDPHASIRQGNDNQSTNSAVFPVSVAVKLRIGCHFLPLIGVPESSEAALGYLITPTAKRGLHRWYIPAMKH